MLGVMIAEAEAEQSAPKGSKTFGQTVDAYMDHLHRIGRSPSTVSLYTSIRKQITYLADLPLSELTAGDLDLLYGVRSPSVGRRPAPSEPPTPAYEPRRQPGREAGLGVRRTQPATPHRQRIVNPPCPH